MFFELIHNFRNVSKNLLGSVGKSKNFTEPENDSLFLPLIKIETIRVEDVTEEDLGGVLRLNKLKEFLRIRIYTHASELTIDYS